MKRRTYIVAALSALLIAGTLYAAALGVIGLNIGNGKPLAVVGSETLTTTASTVLTVPSDADYAVMTVRTAGIHMLFRLPDATAPATTSDPYFPPGVYTFDNQRSLLTGVTVIDSSDGASVTNVIYLKRK